VRQYKRRCFTKSLLRKHWLPISIMSTDVHKKGTDDGWHGVIEEGGQFPPEKDRYHLYIGIYFSFRHWYFDISICGEENVVAVGPHCISDLAPSNEP
jgi:hypothetical protein